LKLGVDERVDADSAIRLNDPVAPDAIADLQGSFLSVQGAIWDSG